MTGTERSLSPRCHDISGSLNEDLAGTAPHARGWLLVEHHGPWGRDGISDSGLPAAIVDSLRSRALQAGVRIQLIRRHRDGMRGLGETAIVVSSDPAGPWLERYVIDGPDDLAELPLDAPSRAAAGMADGRPVVLVCTHARRDACCAQYGRPLAAALSRLPDVDVWETSHTGGHRFAPNLIVLPEGLVYGRLGAVHAIDLLHRHAAGLVDVVHLRGRSFEVAWGQVAEIVTRRELGLTALHDVHVIEVRPSGDQAVVHVAAGADRVRLLLSRSPSGITRSISCGAGEEVDPGVFAVSEFRREER